MPDMLIDDIRRRNLSHLVGLFGGVRQLADKIEKDPSQLSQWINGSLNSGTGKPRGMRSASCRTIEEKIGYEQGWLDKEHPEVWEEQKMGGNVVRLEKKQREAVLISQYNTGGSMGRGLDLRDQPGIIESWRVNPEWLERNVRAHTSSANLCIVTGFGDSMQPMFNPGDPLLVDIGVTSVDFDSVYFFRIENEGYVKRLQRIPTPNGLMIRAISENRSAYEPFDITSTMDFQVLGRVLKVWRSQDF